MTLAALLDAIERDDDREVRDLVTRDPALARATTESGVSMVLLARYLGRHDSLVQLINVVPELTLAEAAAVGDRARVGEVLATRPAAARELTVDGFTPLHLAAYFSHPQIVRALLAAGADPDAVARNASQVRPLHSATAGGDVDCVRLLVVAGADVCATQHGGYTPAHAAVSHGDAMVAVLVEAGASLDVAADDGRTAREVAPDLGMAKVDADPAG